MKLGILNKTAHMKIEIQHTYTEAHAIVYTKNKDQIATPVHKASMDKNHYNNTVLYIIRHMPNLGCLGLKYDTLI